jgi:hypothetical protein
MKFTKELFDRYLNAMNRPKIHRTGEYDITAMAKEYGYKNGHEFEDDLYIFAVLFCDKEKVMKQYSMGEVRYREARALWADEKKRWTE